MTERHIIIMNPRNAQLVHESKKTQTRLIMRPQPEWVEEQMMFWDGVVGMIQSHKCPYGVVGDRLWIREDIYTRDDAMTYGDGSPVMLDHFVRTSIQMPSWACRTVLEITGVRVERVQDITDEDAIAEGVELIEGGMNPGDFSGCWRNYDRRESAEYWNSPRESFHSLWEWIHGDGAWDLNPWVWVVEFRRVQAEESADEQD